MGMYTGLRFKGIVKPEYRKGFEEIGEFGEWGESKHRLFRNFSYNAGFRSTFIPCGQLCYMPSEWDETNEFNRFYHEKTGKWIFQCSLKNYEGEIDYFLGMIPEFIEQLDHCEVRYEEWEESKFYKLVDGQLKEES